MQEAEVHSSLFNRHLLVHKLTLLRLHVNRCSCESRRRHVLVVRSKAARSRDVHTMSCLCDPDDLDLAERPRMVFYSFKRHNTLEKTICRSRSACCQRSFCLLLSLGRQADVHQVPAEKVWFVLNHFSCSDRALSLGSHHRTHEPVSSLHATHLLGPYTATCSPLNACFSGLLIEKRTIRKFIHVSSQS